MYSDEGKKLLYNHVDEPKRESDRVCHLCGAECGKGSDWGTCLLQKLGLYVFQNQYDP